MAKELRIEVAVVLPDDMFEQAAIVSRVGPAMLTFLGAVEECAGEGSVKHEAAIVVPKPRTPADAVPLPGKPSAAKEAA